MKSKWLMMVVALFLLGIPHVFAKEVFYTTPNGIELTEKEYNFLTNYYWDTYPDEMTNTQYEEFKNSDLLSRKLQVKTNDSSKGTWHSSTYKTLKIASACSSSDCMITITATWTYDPATRSYDVIGARFSGVSLISHDYTYVSYNSGYNYYNNTKTFYNGIGNSVKLPDTGTNIRVIQQITTSTGGMVFGSYQHATTNTTLPVSKYYTIDAAGYGSVFLFYGSAVGIYDGFGGVDITI